LVKHVFLVLAKVLVVVVAIVIIGVVPVELVSLAEENTTSISSSLIFALSFWDFTYSKISPFYINNNSFLRIVSIILF
jgi:hypothetical protein